MVLIELSHPSHPLVLVVLLNLKSDIAIYLGVGHQVGAYLVEEFSHFFIAAKAVVEYPCFP